MFATGAAPEVLAHDQDLRVPVWLLVQDEVRALRAVLVVADVVEQVLAEAGALDRLQEARGDDAVGIDVTSRHRSRNAGDLSKLFHSGFPLLATQPFTSSRTSVRWPVMAAAAAIAGLTRWVRPPGP